MVTEKRHSYDYIIAGMGASGLSMAMQLKSSKVPFDKVLLIDQELKNKNDRTWCFWSQEKQTWYDPIIYKRWNQFEFKSKGFEKKFTLNPFAYVMIKGIDFYTYCLEALKDDKRFEIKTEKIDAIGSENGCAVLKTKQATYHAKHLFNSAFRTSKIKKNDINYVQHFKGWVIETPIDSFDEQCPVFMDFTTEQEHDCRFFYVIPFSKRKALVEYTGFSPEVLPSEIYDQKLAHYIQHQLGIIAYEIKEIEYGEIPMMESAFINPHGKHVTNIGTAGGSSKMSTGYTFYFIQKNTLGLVRQLENKGTLTYEKSSYKFKLYDSVLLDVMHKQRMPSDDLFTALFKNNKISNLLSFLNEETSIKEDLSVLYSVPSKPFIQSAFLKLMGL